MKDGLLITEPKSLASSLHDFFTSIGRTLAARFNVITLNTVKQVTSTMFNLKKIETDFVLKGLSQSPILLKSGAIVIAPICMEMW